MSEVTTPDGLRKFRFGAGGEGNKEEGGARKFVKLAQTAEEYGYDTFAVPDHLGNQVGRKCDHHKYWYCSYNNCLYNGNKYK